MRTRPNLWGTIYICQEWWSWHHDLAFRRACLTWTDALSLFIHQAVDAGALVMTRGVAIESDFLEPSHQNVRTNEENAPFLHVGNQWSRKPNITAASVSVPATGCASKRRDRMKCLFMCEFHTKTAKKRLDFPNIVSIVLENV